LSCPSKPYKRVLHTYVHTYTKKGRFDFGSSSSSKIIFFLQKCNFQNIIYRHESTQSKAKDPNVLDSDWALVHITIPAILGEQTIPLPEASSEDVLADSYPMASR
jgi:hypothetical protein